jgi:hypothetical protein
MYTTVRVVAGLAVGKARVCRFLAHPGILCDSSQDTHGASREQPGARIPRTGARRVRRPPWDLFEGVELHASATLSSPLYPTTLYHDYHNDS